MPYIEYRWFDGEPLQKVLRDFVPRVDDHVCLRGHHDAMKVESVCVDEREGQIVIVTLNEGDYTEPSVVDRT